MTGPTLLISEVFRSIQGESTWAGCPCVFVRLAGCHLRCRYCDTEYALTGGERRSISAILEEVGAYGVDLVQVTGGEPLLQRDVHRLISALCDRGKTVLVETSGACDISGCDPRAIRIVDVKCPGSGEVDRNLPANIDRLTSRDEVKFVITDREDYDWARAFIDRHELPRRVRAVLLSPVSEQPAGVEVAGCPALPPQELASWLLAEPPESGPVRMQCQLHKVIWDPQMPGV